MLRFLRTLSLFLLPLVLLFAPSLILFLAAGEAYSIESVEQQAESSTTVLFGPAYSDYWALFQLKTVQHRAPEVLALGSSRVGQFRGNFFKDPQTFYTASAAAFDIPNLTNFVRALGTSTPRVIIVSMDQHLFDPRLTQDYITARPNVFASHDPAVGDYLDVFLEGYFRDGGWWKISIDLLKNRISIGDVFRHESGFIAIGLRAKVEHNGNINDGSHYYAGVLESQEQRQTVRADIHAEALSVTDTHGYEYADGISERPLNELREFLALCQARGIQVVGFIPPVPHEVYAAIQAHPNATYQKTFKELPIVLGALYKAYGFELYDFTDITTFGGSDAEMVDINHGSEKMYARMTVAMGGKGSALSTYIDTATLQKKIAGSDNPFVLFRPAGL